MVTRNLHGWFLGAVILVVATVVACGGEPGELPSGPVATPTPAATATATASPAATAEATATLAPHATATPPPTPGPSTATPTASPPPTPAATTAPTPAPSDPDATDFRYSAYDTTGVVATPGSYAFLADAGDPSTAVTTYEGLRDGTATTLLIHTTDAAGVSRADIYDAVEVGDLFEWRQADDCFVRYQVTEVRPDPTGTVPRKLLAVEWMTYAFTGCSGAIPVHGDRIVSWAPSSLQSPDITAPVRHGPWQLLPDDWTGQREAPVTLREHSPVSESYDLAVVKHHPLWVEPDLPDGWQLRWAQVGYEGQDGINATYVGAGGHLALEIQVKYLSKTREWGFSPVNPQTLIFETRVIDGHPAFVEYSPANNPAISTLVRIYDPATEIEYLVLGHDETLRGSNIDAVIEIARGLLAAAPSPASSPPTLTTFRYDTYDTTGAVATAGSYAFLADVDDPSTAVTTYEGLRDGTSTALLIHTSDADGIQRAGVYDAVEVGDLFEWHESDDCFVRYTVTDVKPDPTGTVRHKLLAVEWMTYAFTGCSGAIPASVTVGVVWGPLPNLGGTSLTVPVVHGIFQVVPPGWEGETKAVGPRFPAGDPIPTVYTTSLAEARRLPHWREPELPEGWTFTQAVSGDEPEAGYFEAFYDDFRLVVSASEIGARYGTFEAVATYNSGSGTNIRETLQVAGRPAMLEHSPNDPQDRAEVYVWDEATDVLYKLRGSPDVATLLRFAESLFDEEAPPAGE